MELVDLYVHDREREELVRLGLVAGGRKRERCERRDLFREMQRDGIISWTTETDWELCKWLALPTWKRWFWTAIR